MVGKMDPTRKMRIGFIHPDLGIGGAERLVVDAAVSLQNRGHEVVMFTSRHDPSRCFEETRNGTLKVHVLGSSLPMRLHPKAPLTIVFSILRSLLLTLLLLFSLMLPAPASFFNPLSPLKRFDVFVVDQQSVCVPLLRLVSGSRVVFYCHFPDKLLSAGWTVGQEGRNLNRKAGLLRRIYRWPVDKLEEWTTGQSDVILANSNFTSRVYTSAFPSLAKRKPRVVYPCIDLAQYSSKGTKGKSKSDPAVDVISSDRPTLISLNRFEEKKNVALAIKAFARIHHSSAIPSDQLSALRLVIAGGYDDRLDDNIRTLRSLRQLCDDNHLPHHTVSSSGSVAPPAEAQVLFLLNFSNAQRTYLLTSPHTLCLLYTPSNEHFGIVPVEAGACGLPVLATNTGGPLETVLDPQTGLLRPPTVDAWAQALEELVTLHNSRRKEIASAAKSRVKNTFSLDTLGKEMEESCREAWMKGDVHTDVGDSIIWASLGIMAVSGGGLLVTVLASRFG